MLRFKPIWVVSGYFCPLLNTEPEDARGVAASLLLDEIRNFTRFIKIGINRKKSNLPVFKIKTCLIFFNG